ncbi:transcriptional regulator [Pasteurellaceae bacterium RH1A]|nr:transcriptional regulator [Pasteurellaceae bacterium RH1A]
MSVHDKIRVMREIKQWSQEEMAEKMNMSLNGYAKIERGETKLSLEKLEQIANIFNMDAIEFMNNKENGVFFLMNEHGDNHNNTTYYSGNDSLTLENEKLKLALKHHQDLLKEKERQIASLNEIIQLLKSSRT